MTIPSTRRESALPDELLSLVGPMTRMSGTREGTVTAKRFEFERLTPDSLREAVEIVTPATRMVDIFEEWATRHDFDGASFAVIRRGRIAARSSFRNGSARQMNEFASCSKLITGLCITQLVRQNRLRFDQRMEEIFGAVFRIDKGNLDDIVLITKPHILDKVAKTKLEVRDLGSQPVFDFPAFNRGGPARVGAPLQRAYRLPQIHFFPDWFRKITVQELLTHTSGINGDIGEHHPYEITIDERFARIVTVMTPNATKAHSYENNNYLVLGKIIEHVTRLLYADACRQLVFEPISVSAFDADNRGPYAGCFLSTVDYARMLKYFDREFGLLGDLNADHWPRDAASGYSIGTYVHFTDNGNFVAEHGGAWTWGDSTRNVSLGAHHHYWSDIRTGYFVQHSPLAGAPHGELDQALTAAVYDPSDPWAPFLDLIRDLQRLV